MRKLVKFGAPLFILIGLLLWTTNTVQAQLTVTAIVSSWDIQSLKYENGNIRVYWDGGWQPFLHQLTFDGIAYDSTQWGGCGLTPWAGVMEYGVAHTDNAPLGAPGFQETRNWRVVDCDRNGNNKFDTPDLSVQPPDGFTVYENLTPLWQDIVVTCTTGNCLNELVTTLYINLDKNCDGFVDAGVPANRCFYAEARRPYESVVSWGGNIQGRVSAGGGEKTVNLSPLSPPLAVTLASFTATWDGNVVRVAWETTTEIQTVGFNLWSSTVSNGDYVQINDTLIPSASPGGMQGASYSYTDADVTPGTVYYYLLEELEVGGGSNWYGPGSTNGGIGNTAVVLSAIGAEGWENNAIFIWWRPVAVAIAAGVGLLTLARLRRRR